MPKVSAGTHLATGPEPCHAKLLMDDIMKSFTLWQSTCPDMRWGNVLLWNVQERKTALSSDFMLRPHGAIDPRKAAVHFKRCCNPETMTEADVAQLAQAFPT